jgi:DNA-binding transcriptional ArsR family regulator
MLSDIYHFSITLKMINYIQEIEFLNIKQPMDRDFLYTLEAETFNALAHPARIEILELLRDSEACVCHIQTMLDQRQAYISQHLNVLRRAGLVTCRKEGLRVYYQARNPQVYALLEAVKTVLLVSGQWQPDLTIPTGVGRRNQACTCPQCSSELLTNRVKV